MNILDILIVLGSLGCAAAIGVYFTLRAQQARASQEHTHPVLAEPENAREQQGLYDHLGFIAPPGTPCPEHGPYEGETCSHAICWECGATDGGCFCEGETGVCLFPVRYVRDTSRIVQPYESEGRRLPRAQWTA